MSQKYKNDSLIQSFEKGRKGVNYFGTLVSTLGFNPIVFAFASSSVSFSEADGIQTLYTGEIGYEKAMRDGMIGSSLGVVGDNINVSSKNIGVSIGIRLSRAVPYVAPKVMNMLQHSAKYIDDVFPYFKNFGIGVTENAIQKEAEGDSNERGSE